MQVKKNFGPLRMGVPSFCHTIEQWLYFFFYSDLFQVVIGAVVEGGESGRVGSLHLSEKSRDTKKSRNNQSRFPAKIPAIYKKNSPAVHK